MWQALQAAPGFALAEHHGATFQFEPISIDRRNRAAIAASIDGVAQPATAPGPARPCEAAEQRQGRLIAQTPESMCQFY